MRNKHVNAVVIGSGAGGGVVAKELATGGMSVVLFERGQWPDRDRNGDDELIARAVFRTPFGPDIKKHPRVLVLPDGTRRVMDGRFHNIAACVGSGTVNYAAMAWRFMKEDLTMRSTYGDVEGSTLEDWAVAYDALEPYYEKAEWEVGVSGDDYQNPFAPPRKKKQPMPPFEYNREGQVIFDAARRLGLHPFPLPMLRNSVPYNGRAACIRNRSCLEYACPVNAKNGTHNTVIPVAMKTGNCEVRTGCMVAEIMIDEHGRARGVKYFDGDDKGQIQTADVVVVSAAAIETARLLLNSKSKLFPNGAGNNNDWVGRNIQGHAYTGAYGLFDYDILDFTGPGATVAFSDYAHNNPGIIGGGLLANECNRLPYKFSGIRPPGSAMWGKEHKEFQKKQFHRTGMIFGPIQDMPVWESRVTVDPEVKDHWGIPVAALSGLRHPLDHEHCKWLSARAEEVLKEAGAYKTWLAVGGRGGPSGGRHQCGTARMGHDPQTSVVNQYGQVHEIDNLFLADGSIMVTSGAFNPALTIMALGYRVGEYIVKNFA